MFDWDDDFEDLIKGDGPTKPAIEYSPPPQDVPTASPEKGSLWVALSRWVAPALVVTALAAGVTFPEKFGFGGQSVQTAQLFAPFPIMPTPETATVTLRAYSDAQQRSFLSGLKQFSDADLLSYATIIQADLDRAGVVMAPLLQDALTLTQMEIKRRNLVAPTVVRAVQDVLIQVPLQG